MIGINTFIIQLNNIITLELIFQKKSKLEKVFEGMKNIIFKVFISREIGPGKYFILLPWQLHLRRNIWNIWVSSLVQGYM